MNEKYSEKFNIIQLEPCMSVNTLFTAFTREYQEDFFFEGESHPMWELDCILSGESGITSGSRLYECPAGSLVIHPADIFHTAWAMNNQPVRVLTITFTGKGLEEYVPQGKFTLTEEEIRLIGLLEKEIGPQSLNKSKTIDELQIVKGLLEILLLSLNRRRDISAGTVSGREADRFSRIVDYMKARVCDPVDISLLCTECGIGRSALKELFRHYTGTGAIKYYNYLRIRHAIRLMKSDKTIAEIAEEMNFSSQNYFSSFFKRETGTSPLQYKRSLEKKR